MAIYFYSLEAQAQWIGEPYVQNKGVSKETHLTSIRQYVGAIHKMHLTLLEGPSS